MEFLKEVLGEELYKQVETAMNAYNSNEANKEKQVKLANLATGEYVGKGKYDALNEQLTGKLTELDTANNLIADLKKGTKGNEEMQGKITAYEAKVNDLRAQLQETKLKSAIKIALLSEKAVDVDYLTYRLESKLKTENKKIELDDNDNIKDWNDYCDSLKTQFPNMFESSYSKKFYEQKLPDKKDEEKGLTKTDILKMPYQERAKFQSENPEEYQTIMKG